MKALRFTLFSKILLWFFLNLLVLGGVLFLFFNLHFRLTPDSFLLRDANQRIEALALLISAEVSRAPRTEWEAILARYSRTYPADFLLFANDGEQLAGEKTSLPPEGLERLKRQPNPPPNQERPDLRLPDLPPEQRGPLDRRPPPIFSFRTTNPTRYWTGVRVPVRTQDRPEPIRATVLARSDSLTGHGLFFDPKPWLIILAVVLSLSILLWLPFVRSLTRTIKQMTVATEQIAEEHFNVHVNERRSDELGRLGKAINHLATRLAGFVHGQKRFLGDVSHELNSPLARLQFALSILEERVDSAHQTYVADAQEEVRVMTQLVNELLAYAKAGLKTTPVTLERVQLRALIERIIAREATEETEINVEIDKGLSVTAQPELLARAVGNLIRNAIRYAGTAGPITISAHRENQRIRRSIKDSGSGVPEDALEKLFDPFYRLEADRGRNTGGAGLGLAIVKSCVEACQGTVSARNCQPRGFEVNLSLSAATE